LKLRLITPSQPWDGNQLIKMTLTPVLVELLAASSNHQLTTVVTTFRTLTLAEQRANGYVKATVARSSPI
jgi:hypothetical protein